jgi:hypothetical protein
MVCEPAASLPLLNRTPTEPVSTELECFLSMTGESTPSMSIKKKPFLFAVFTEVSTDMKATISPGLSKVTVVERPSMSSALVAVVVSDAT